jgi:hypothetical protein
MRWLRVVTSVAAGGLLLACEPSPTATDDVEVGTISMSLDGNSSGAVVVRGDIGCSVVDGTGAIFPEDWSLPCGTEVATFSENLNAKVTVQASGVPNPSGETVHWGPYNPGQGWVALYPDLTGPPYPCFVLGTDRDLDNPLYTVNWHATVTPSGNGKLVCVYQKKWDFQCEDYGNCAP